MAKQVTNKDLFAPDVFKKTTEDVSKLITEIKEKGIKKWNLH